MSHLSWEYKITIFCLMLSVLFCLSLGVEWWYGRSYRAEILEKIFKVDKANFEMQPIPEYPFIDLPVEHYSDFVERPIFFEGRKPIAKIEEAEKNAAQSAPKAPVEEFKLVLTGITNTPHGVKALFQDPTAAAYADRYKRLKQGDIHAGWQIIDIQSDKVSIQAESETKEIPLLKAKAKKPGALATPAGVPPPVPPPPVPPGNINPFNIKH